MKRCRTFNPVLYIFLFFALSVQAQNTRYNIIFISSDDLADRLSMLGNTEVLTPNLDRLAARSMVFTNCFVQFPLCSPSRTSFLLGWRPDKTGIIDDTTRPRTIIGPNVKFLPEYFKSYGYRIESYGKTLHHTFESDIAWNYFEPPERKISDFASAENVLRAADTVKWWIDNVPDSLDIDGREARNFVTRLQASKNQQPYFYCLGFHAPHNPFTPNLKYWNLYGDPSAKELLKINERGDFSNVKGNGSEPIVLPPVIPHDRKDVPAIAFKAHPSIILSDSEWKRTIHAYDAEVSEMDAQLGLVLDEMDRQNLWANTIVIFVSDHGQHLGEHEGTWKKETLFNESLHVPLIIYVPGKKGGICSKLIENVDIYATLAELCGLASPPGMEGTSFVPLLDNPTLTWKKAVFSQVYRNDRTLGGIMARTICTGRYRYTTWDKAGEELYDHKIDPHEFTNVATDSTYAKALKRMRKILAGGWRNAVPPKSSTTRQGATAKVDGASESKSSSFSLKLYPNPSKGFVNINYNCNSKGEIVINVYNILGRQIFTKTTQAAKGSNNYSFDFSDFTSGIYYLEVTDEFNEQEHLKFTIEK